MLDDIRLIHAARRTRMTDRRHGYPIAASSKPPRSSAERLNPVHLFGGSSQAIVGKSEIWRSLGTDSETVASELIDGAQRSDMAALADATAAADKAPVF